MGVGWVGRWEPSQTKATGGEKQMQYNTTIDLQYHRPTNPFIGREDATERLYSLEHKRNVAIEAAAKELGKLLGFEDKQFWTRTLPEELYSILESYDQNAAKIAALAFLERHGFKVEP